VVESWCVWVVEHPEIVLLQCVAVWCSAVLYGTVWCSVLQCVAVFCKCVAEYMTAYRPREVLE